MAETTEDHGIHEESTWEIEEVSEANQEGPPLGIPQGVLKGASDADDDVYVAVGKGGSSMVALQWALKHLAKPYSFVYLVHVFPVVTSIPTPLGMMPKSQASPEQVEACMNQERAKRREMLQKFLDLCLNFQVQVDIFVIESDQIANAVIELIPVLNIKLLVVGTSKSNVRKLKKGSTIAGQIQKNAPLYCDVKIVCDGKEVTVTTTDPTPPFSPSHANTTSKSDNPMPPSSTPTHNNRSTTDDKKDSKPKDKKKVSKFLRCFSF